MWPKVKAAYPESKENIFNRCKKILKVILEQDVLSAVADDAGAGTKSVLIASHMDTVNWLLPIWSKIDAALFEKAAAGNVVLSRKVQAKLFQG